jgi:hypothetical protein
MELVPRQHGKGTAMSDIGIDCAERAGARGAAARAETSHGGVSARRALLRAADIAVIVCGVIALLAFYTAVNQKFPGYGAIAELRHLLVRWDEEVLLVITVDLITLAPSTRSKRLGG